MTCGIIRKEEIEKHSHIGAEALRILAMLMIISGHYAAFGGIRLPENVENLNYWLSYVVKAFEVGVNCYVLITGYFLIKSHGFKWRKILKLWLTVFFYSVSIYLFLVAAGWVIFSKKALLEAMLPIKTNAYWFISSYMALYLLFPYLNMIVEKLDKINYQKLLGILIGLFSVFSFYKGDPFRVEEGSSLLWFIVLYFIGGYIRLHVESIGKKKLMLVYVISSLAIFAISLGIYLFKFHFGVGQGMVIPNAFFNHNSPLRLLTSVALFLFFINWQICNKNLVKIIKFFAPLTLGVYLVHMHPYLGTEVLWLKWLNVPAALQTGSICFLVHYALCVVGVFIGSSFIEMIRQKMFGLILSISDENK